MIIQWQNYNRAIAQENKIVAHGWPSTDLDKPRKTFFRSNDFAEVEAGTVNVIHSPYVVCAKIDGKPVGVQPAMRKKIWTNMLFLGHVGGGTLDDYDTVMQQTYDVMMQFITRYQHDCETTGACGPFQRFDPKNLLFQEIGPVAQYDYGWRLRIEFLMPAPELSYDPSKWHS